MCIACEMFHAQAGGGPACIDGFRRLTPSAGQSPEGGPAGTSTARSGDGSSWNAFQNTLSVQGTGERRIDGIIYGERWEGSEVTYSDPDDPSDFEPGYRADDNRNGLQAFEEGLRQLTPAQAAVVHAALTTEPHGQRPAYAGFSVEGFTRLKLTYAGAGSGQGTIRLANSKDPHEPDNTAYTFLPAPFGEGGDVWFDRSGNRPRMGNYDHLTILHELGHALGLKHGHEDFIFARQPKAYDALEYTLMSYRSFVGDNLKGYKLEAWSFPQTYMMLDIAALQHIYGADFETRAGDTVYSWEPGSGRTFVDGKVATAPGGNRIFLTVWDGGGRDRYDLSAYRAGVVVDLAPGSSSVFARAQLAELGGEPNSARAAGNVYNALRYKNDLRSLIEDATGGSGADTLRGNQVGNTLEGGPGADVLWGFDGNDFLNGGRGPDELHGGNGADRLRGGGGQDVLIGGKGADVFVFDREGGSKPGRADVIRAGEGAVAFEGAGQAGGDVIDVSRIDADPTVPGNQPFGFGSRKAGGLWLTDRGEDTVVRAKLEKGAGAAFALLIEDAEVLAAAYGADDFLL